jgi:hypothetical protein
MKVNVDFGASELQTHETGNHFDDALAPPATPFPSSFAIAVPGTCVVIALLCGHTRLEPLFC